MEDKMTPIYTNVKTLSKVKALLNEIGLTNEDNFNIMNILDKLLDDGKLAEFMQIITRDTQTDWDETELSEIKEIISRFFASIMDLLPESIRNMIIPVMNQETLIEKQLSDLTSI